MVSPHSSARAARSFLKQVGVGGVRPTGVGGDQQPGRARVVLLALLVPPAADGLHREGRSVAVRDHVHPAGVLSQVVDAVRDRDRSVGVCEVVVWGRDRRPFGAVGAARSGEVADRLLLLRIHAHHRQTLGQEPLGRGVDVPELSVAVGDMASGAGLGHTLEAEAPRAQQLAHGRGADRVACRGQLPGQVSQRGRGPAQRGDRVADLLRLDQGLECRHQARVALGCRSTSAAGAAHPSQHRGAAREFVASPRDGRLRYLRQPGYRRGPAMPEGIGLQGQVQAALSLVQMRQHRRELHVQHCQDGFRDSYGFPLPRHRPHSPRIRQ